MKKQLSFISACLFMFSTSTFAAGGGVPLMHIDTNLNDKASLQEGAKIFVNYCSGCHSADFMRFSRIGKDLGITDQQLQDNLMFATDKVGDPMWTAMDKDDAERWFGVAPPDLSVIARARGTDWLYTYMMTFYKDESRPWGVNNLVFKDVGMPHVLWELQGGVAEPVYKTVKDEGGHEHQEIDKLVVPQGDMSDAQYQKMQKDYQRAMANLVAFLEYMGEPAKLQRYDLGAKVIVFLLIFFLIAYLLKKEFWRDVH